MKERRNTPTPLSDRLPVHQPDDRLWNGISSSLGELEAREQYEKRLATLPVHSPDQNSWAMLLRRMQRAKAYRIAGYSMMAAASLLILLMVFYQPEQGIRENTQVQAQLTDKSQGQKSGITDKSAAITTANQVPVKGSGQTASAGSSDNYYTANQDQNPEIIPSVSTLINESAILLARLSGRTELPLSGRNRYLPLYRKLEQNQRSFTAYQPADIQRNYEPVEVEPRKDRNFTLAANYLPESLENGNGTSMFHNFGLMASMGNENTRILSSVGLAYNAEHREYDVNYTQFIPITVPNPGNPADSTAIMEATGATELQGTERHQYLTYDLGLGKKLFSVGKMTTWVNTGAGIAFRLDDASLKEATIKTINQHNNSQVNNINLDIPDYNGININLIASLDFNYRIMNRLSISFAPTSRFYLKPVLLKDGNSTDSFSLGFRSGMKFDF
jgi:hypothetical protein